MPTSPLIAKSDSLLFVHQGGLGDFFLAWPLFASLVRHFPNKICEFAGPASRLPFLTPLGVRPASAGRSSALRAIQQGSGSETALADTLIVHPSIRPQLYQANVSAICPYMLAKTGAKMHAEDRLFASLAQQGLVLGKNEANESRTLFPKLFAQDHKRFNEVLLIAGAGHPAKAWHGAAKCPVQFFLLAEILKEAGYSCRFVLGPDELEQGLDIRGQACIAPDSPAELAKALSGASLVIGGDTGALHLASLLGRPTLGLFGPTDEAVWGPKGARILRAACAKGPCVELATDIDCPQAHCLGSLTPARVAAAACELLHSQE